MRAPRCWILGLCLVWAGGGGGGGCGAGAGAGGPKDSREPTQPRTASRQDSSARCQARIRCYRTIITHQIAVVSTLRVLLKEAASGRAAQLSSQLRVLVGPHRSTTLAACRIVRTRLMRAISLLKGEYVFLIRQAVARIARRLKDPDEFVRQAAHVALGALKQDMRLTRQKLTGLKVCRPFARRK